MPDEIDIKLCDDDDDDEEKIKTEIKRIKKKDELYKTLWRLFTISNKSLMIINFTTILFSIFNPKSNIPLILSIFTLSFSIICDTRIYENILEKLIAIYEEEIIFEIDKYVRNYHKREEEEEEEKKDAIYDIQQIEKKHLTNHLGHSFTLPTTLRSMDWKRISVIVVIYVSCFIAIALLCYYTSNEGLALSIEYGNSSNVEEEDL